MKWERLLQQVGQEPAFDSNLLLAGNVDRADLGRQLSRWVKAGKLIQLRRGVYVLGEPYRKKAPHPFAIAHRLTRASYISLQSALAHHGLIPDAVPSVTSITTGRPERLSTPLGAFIFRHVKKEFFFGYRLVDLGDELSAFVATPEKALLDLLYLTPGSDDPGYLAELRLQNLERLDAGILTASVRRFGSAKLERSSAEILRIIGENGPS